jgi:hypothetical protein
MKANNRGIVIVSILVLTLLATFFLGALVQMNPSRLRRNVHDENRDRATMAARAGVDYVLNRFKSDVNWLADANMKTVDMEDLVVREDNGNVLGWIRAEDGSWAGFRVRFNAQDGDGGFDSRGNPNYPITNGSLSLNNLDVPDSRAVPRATSSSVSSGATTTPGDPNTAMVAPENSIALQVEGIVSSDLNPDDPSGLADATDVTIRTIEGIYVISDIVSGVDGDAVLMAGADADITVGARPGGAESSADRDVRGVLSLQSDSDNVAGIRSKGAVSLTRGQGSDAPSKFDPDTDASVLTNPDTPFSETLADGTTFSGGEEDRDATFQKIEWDRVKDSEQSDAVTLPGGVYIFTDGDADGGRSKSGNVKFFDMNWSQYKAALLDTDPSTPVESPVPQSFLDMVELDAVDVSLTEQDGTVSDEKRDRIRVTGDVTIEDPKGNGLTIVPERGARQKAGEDASAPGEPISPSQFNSLGDTEKIGSSSSIMEAIGTVLNNGQQGSPSSIYAAPLQGTSGQVDHHPSLPSGGYDFDNGGVAGIGANSIGQIALGGGVFNIPAGKYSAASSQLDGVQFIPQDVVLNVAGSYDIQVTDPVAFLQSLGFNTPPAALLGGGGGVAADPLHIPQVHPETGQIIGLDPNATEADKTVPQDIEIVFDPADGRDSAFIRSDTDIFLGTHLSGEGGGIISNDEVNLVGFGINIQARTDQNMDEQQERTGVAIYGKNGINISTYDERRNNYWDVEVKGAVFTEGNILVRLGEEDLPSGENPPWGVLDYEGSMIALGNSNFVVAGGVETGGTDQPGNFTTGGDGDGDGDNEGGYHWNSGGRGKVEMIARGVRLFYDPRYLAPYVEESTINPTFAALSVVER